MNITLSIFATFIPLAAGKDFHACPSTTPISEALDLAQKSSDEFNSVILCSEETHIITEPLIIDSTTNLYIGADENVAKITGGSSVDFQLDEASSLYVASITEEEEIFRQLFVNDNRMNRTTLLSDSTNLGGNCSINMNGRLFSLGRRQQGVTKRTAARL